MNGAVLLIGALVWFALAYFLYGRIVLQRLFGVDPARPCPSKTLQDGIDYIPTAAPVLFGHHFASIAGAGPIVGPVLAAAYGWGPAVLWILIGCVFIGAMHDFAAMFLSVRNQGCSIATVIRNELGKSGSIIFLGFCLAALLLVVTSFTGIVVHTFMNVPTVATASILFIFEAPCFGFITGRKILSIGKASLIFVPLLFVLIWVSTFIPLDLKNIPGCAGHEALIWTIILLLYAATASILPVDKLLQPRDYLNSYLLYLMMALGLASILCYHPTLEVPAFVTDKPVVPNVFPLLFVTIACGACSGFHALVSSGTSSRQIAKEEHMLPVAYGGMLIEGVLGIISTISVAYLASDKFAELVTNPETKVAPAAAFAMGLATFCTKLHIPYDLGLTFLSLAVSAFLLTTLDTSTRLARFIWQELCNLITEKDAADTNTADTPSAPSPVKQFFASRWTATAIIILLVLWLALSGLGDRIWPVFGASNQLLAALTLLTVTLWLMRTKRPVLFALLPMIFMMTISVWALVSMTIHNWGKSHIIVVIALILLVMAISLILLSIKTFLNRIQQKDTP